ncbi:MAG: hypothetical protein WEE64_08385 [Dehalococcoidia bacterium]
MLGLLLLAALLLVSAGRETSASSTPIMRLQPSSIEVDNAPGTQFAVDVTIEKATNLGSFFVVVTFDQDFVEVVDYDLGPFLGSTGRAVTCQTVVIEPYRITVDCDTSGASPLGPNGPGVLASITFAVRGVSVGESFFGWGACGASDIIGTQIVNGNCTGAELFVIPPPTPSPTSTLTPTPTPVPHNLKSPALANLFLTGQGGKLPPSTCASSTNTATFVHSISSAPASPDPKDPSELQRVGGFESEVVFDEDLVCVNVEPGAYLTGTAGSICFIDDKDQGLQPDGLARIGCVVQGKPIQVSSSLELARIIVRPQPELYSLIRANQDNGVVVQILNQGCNLTDLQGHPIKKAGCDDSDLTIRWLEGDVNGDCAVDVRDQQILAFRWGVQVGALLYNDRFDLEPSGQIAGDGDIDIKDVQFAYGRHGSTCAAPHPPQPPVNPKFPNATPPPTPTPTVTPTATPSPTMTPTFTPTPTAVPGVPRMNLSPASLDLALTTPPQSGQCADSPDSATFQMQIKDPITSVDPEAPPALQQLAAFEFRVFFDPALVCIQAVGGWAGPSVFCIVDNFTPGLLHFGCVSLGKTPVPPQPPLALATITIRPQPAVYDLVTPGGPPLVAQLAAEDCELADLQGHVIASQECGDGWLSISYP